MDAAASRAIMQGETVGFSSCDYSFASVSAELPDFRGILRVSPALEQLRFQRGDADGI